ncbi:helix-turn-helix domain-containing protein [Streptomyces phaeochromogenes]|uniref:hypothetical protein n=1 Tax=Streptomyces phaeochromogenes TaxID=1923 RepID=UPI002E28888B|nr:hypothetical protein [Streptomyces phaeochromogenes]
MADPQSNAALPAYPSPEHPPPAPPELPPDAPRAGVLHVRHRHTERYTVVGNHLAQHPRLSATAIGIGVHIQSLPDGASVTIKALTLRFAEGEVTISKALRELETAGYLVRRRVPLEGGRFATRTFFLDHPGAVVRASVCGTDSGAAVPVAAPVEPPAAAGDEPEVLPAPTPVAVPAAAEAFRPDSVPTSVRTRRAAPEPGPAPTGPAADLLARLRLADPRLLLSERDVQRLLPAVETWLARAATPDQITHTLTGGLPSEAVPIRHPASLLEYRLTALVPPPLPAAPFSTATVTPAPQLVPLVSCDGCERAVRTHDRRALCRDCRERHGHREAEAVRTAA